MEGKYIKNKIINIINEENKKNPLTDEDISLKLNISREIVTKIRKQEKIPNSRDRKNEKIEEEILEIIKEKGKISIRTLTKELNKKEYNIGKYAVSKYYEKLNIESFEKKVADKKKKKKNDFFKDYIGYDKSLKNCIDKLKAAIMYPPKGLHTIIYGDSGVGKSYLAKLAYDYALSTENFEKKAPYFEFNCADYAENPQLLVSQLFGHAKGSFTGADENKKGIVELCDGGILFLDEVHRLPSEGQEILFSLIDKGKYRRLGENEVTRESRLMIIAATTETPESALLLTFRRRIPMSINIPSLKDRSIEEKYDFIKYFLYEETVRLENEIEVDNEVMKKFLETDYPGNIGQLKSDIQVSCARAFLDSKISDKNIIIMRQEHLPDFSKREKIIFNEKILNNTNITILPEESKKIKEKNKMDDINIYKKIEKKYDELTKKGIEKTEINLILEEELKKELFENILKFKEKDFDYQELSQIVGKDILNSVLEAYDYAKKEFNDLNSKIIFPLSIHIKSSIDRLNEGKLVEVPILFKGNNEKEYNVAKEILAIINNRNHLNLPESEIKFIFMYINEFRKNEKYDGKIVLIVLSHGKVATGMANVANRILNEEYAVGLDMEFSDTPEYMLDKTVQLVQQIDKGKGCILLVDMGSLLNLETEIFNRTGINVRIVGRVDTLMVIECLRKVLYTSESIDEIAEELSKSNSKIAKYTKNKRKAIVCLCITGKGAALVIKNYLQERLGSLLDGIDIITKGYIEGEDTEDILDEISEKSQIIAVIGSLQRTEIKNENNYFSVEDIYKLESLKKIREIIKNEVIYYENNLNEILDIDFIKIKKSKYKENVLDEMIEVLTKNERIDSQFLLSVYKREGMTTTYLNGGIAIPHGEEKFVKKPTIFITKLDKPIIWDGVNMVDIVFLLALNEKTKKYFEKLYRLISNENIIKSIREATKETEILKILCKSTEPVK